MTNTGAAHTIETVDILLPLPEACEPDTSATVAACQRAKLAAGKPRRSRRIRQTLENVVAQFRARRTMPVEQYVANTVAVVLTRDFVRAELEARAAEGDTFAAMALACHR